MSKTPDEIGAEYHCVPISRLRIGAVLRAPIYDARNDRQMVLLLAAGAKLTRSRLDRLQTRGITMLMVHADDQSRVVRPETKRALAPPEDEERSSNAFNISKDSFVHNVEDHGAADYAAEKVQQMASEYGHSRATVQDLFHNLADGYSLQGQVAVHVTDHAIEELAEDLDLFVRLSIDRENDNGRYGHGLKTARIALAIGTVMGLKRDDLLELGIGCLIHDIGMSKVDPALLNRKGPIRPIEFLDIMKHPTHTYELLMDARDIPPGARMVAYQIHERWDGSGYPRQRRGAQIHPLSRIGAVADTFAALLSDRPHRPAITAPQAMREILLDAKRGLYDPEAVQGLLKTMALFPIGSAVQLSDGRVGIVIRANHRDYCRPIVELWDDNNFAEPGEIVDISQHPRLSIVRSIPKTDLNASRVKDLA